MSENKNIEALEKSIQHWKENAVMRERRYGATSDRECALCALYFDIPECKGCPVATFSGQSACQKTPYEAANGAFFNWKYAIENDEQAHVLEEKRADFHRKAQRMVEFLEMLLEKEKAK